MASEVSLEQVQAALGDKATVVDEAIVEYLCSILSDETSSRADLVEAITPLLSDAGVGDDGQVEKMCERMLALSLSKNMTTSSSARGDTQLLDSPVTMQLIEDAMGSWGASEMQKQVEYSTLVDKKKLEMHEIKMRERSEKRAVQSEKKKAKQYERAIGYLQSAAPPIFTRSNAGRPGQAEITGTSDIRLDNISISTGHNELITNANLILAFGRRYGLVGRNGAGKTTLLRYISNREIPIPTSLSILHVEQEAEGDDTTVLRAVIEADYELVQLWKEEQEILASEGGHESFRLQTIYRRLQEIDASTAESRASAILSGLSFDPQMQSRPTKEFSGGWRMRIALARALFCEPDILLLDEPTNHLDFHAIVWLERFLNGWQKTLIIVSHQRDFLNSVCTDVIHLTKKTLVYYRGNYDDFERVASEKLRQQQREHDAQQSQISHMQAFVDRFRYNAKRAKMAQSRIKKIERMSLVSAVVEEEAVSLPFDEPEDLSPPILQFEDVSFHYPNDPTPLFSNLNLGIDMDSRIALVGRNGSGKSTLMKLFSEEISPTTGTVHINRKLKFASFSQHFVDQLDLNLSPLEYLLSLSPTAQPLVLRSHLGKYGITGDLALRSMQTLSGGQKSRVVFAKMALSKPHILLLDEPSNHLDIETIEGLARSLNVFSGGVLLISHDQRLISLVCDEIWHLEGGKVVRWDGDVEDYKRYLESTAP